MTDTTVPTYVCGEDGDEPIYISHAHAPTEEDAVRVLMGLGYDDAALAGVKPCLMRPLDRIAMKIRGVGDYNEWWVECTPRSKRAVAFWRYG